ncbi:MAG TPA: hypothetical protein VF710_19910 [Longimicrobium sp.]
MRLKVSGAAPQEQCRSDVFEIATDLLEKMIDAEYTGEDLSLRALDAEGNPIPNNPGGT